MAIDFKLHIGKPEDFLLIRDGCAYTAEPTGLKLDEVYIDEDTLEIYVIEGQ